MTEQDSASVVARASGPTPDETTLLLPRSCPSSHSGSAQVRARLRPPWVSSKSKDPFNNVVLGVGLCFLASCGYCTMGLFLRKAIQSGVSVGVVVLVRSLLTLLLSATIVAVTTAVQGSAWASFPGKEDVFLIVLRGLIGALRMLAKYVGVSLLPLSLATTLFLTSPAITVLLSKPLLNEPYDCATIVSCVASFVGVLFIAFDDDSVPSVKLSRADRALGVLVSVAAAIFTAGGYISGRRNSRNVHAQANVLSLGFFASLVGLLMLVYGYRSDEDEWSITMRYFPVVLGSGIGAYVDNSCVSWALQLLGAGPVSLLVSMEVPLSIIFGIVFLGEHLSSLGTCFGIALITVAALYIGWARSPERKDDIVQLQGAPQTL